MNLTHKKIIIAVGAVFLVMLAAVGVGAVIEKNDAPVALEPEENTPADSLLTEAEARVIAEFACIKGGEALSAGSYNANSKTWWFDANLNATREGCNPACVVSEASRTAELNWSCTGLKNPSEEPAPIVPSPRPRVCGIENCHGLDIICGEHPAEMCTMLYQLGDKCRALARCEVVAGTCGLVENPEFTACKNCAQRCERDFPDDPGKAFACESACGE